MRSKASSPLMGPAAKVKANAAKVKLNVKAKAMLKAKLRAKAQEGKKDMGLVKTQVSLAFLHISFSPLLWLVFSCPGSSIPDLGH